MLCLRVLQNFFTLETPSIIALRRKFIEVNYILTRSDLEKPIARVYIFGLISTLETFLTESMVNLSESTLEKILGGRAIENARNRQQQEINENVELSLIYYLTLYDKIKLLKNIRTKNQKSLTKMKRQLEIQELF